DALARVEIEDRPVGMLESLDRGSPRVDLEPTCLHQADETLQVVNGEHRLRLTDVHGPNGLGEPGPGMLRVKALMHCAGRTAHETERPSYEVRQDPIGDLDIEFGEALLGDALAFPQDAIRVGEANPRNHVRGIGALRRPSLFFRSWRILAPAFLRRLVLAQPLVRCLPEHVVVSPTAELDPDNETQLDPDRALV